MDSIRFFLSALAAIAVGIPLAISTGAIRSTGENLKEDSAWHGRVVTANLISKAFLPPDISSQNSRLRQVRWLAKYNYTVDGQEYTYRCTLGHQAPDQVLLSYPAGRPDKAEIQDPITQKQRRVFLRVLAPVIVWVAVYWALPMVGNGSY